MKVTKSRSKRKLRKVLLRRLLSSQILLILSNRFKRLKSLPFCEENRNSFLVWWGKEAKILE